MSTTSECGRQSEARVDRSRSEQVRSEQLLVVCERVCGELRQPQQQCGSEVLCRPRRSSVSRPLWQPVRSERRVRKRKRRESEREQKARLR